MEVQTNEIDSDVLGHVVLDLGAFDPLCDFARFEREYCDKYHPVYVSCKIAAENIEHVHLLEDHGFRFVEFQVRVYCALNKNYDLSRYGYRYELVEGGADLNAVLDIASSIFEHDRISRDPFFRAWEGRNISGERYRRYVMKSFESADECVYKLVNEATSEIVGFATHRITGPESALLLLAGIKQEYNGAGLGAINDYFGWNELKRKGVKWIHGHASGANYPILNLNVKGMGFRIVQCFVVLRKTYS
jgi:hypothetical protein